MSTATKTIVMTGATRGLGEVAAVELLKANPDVHLAVIARSAGADVVARLQKTSGNANVSVTAADLASLDSIRAATAEIGAKLDQDDLPPLVGFVGNAGLQLAQATDATVDGVEATFAVNVLANYVLIDRLREHFTAGARIVVTTSDTHFGDFRHNQGMVPAPSWRTPTALARPGTALDPGSATAGRTAYSTSKLSLIYLVHALARRLPAPITVFSFNPGLVPGTGLVRDSGAVTRFLFRRVMPIMTLTPFARTRAVSGADLANAATGPLTAASGSYINGAKVERSSPESYNTDREDALWDELTQLAATRPAA